MPKMKGAAVAAPPTGFVVGAPRVLLRLEGMALALASILAYGELGHSWWMFVLLVLMPDLGAVAYLLSSRSGATLYNATHSMLGPSILGFLGFFGSGSLFYAFALIWMFHIGVERAMGLGMRYNDGLTYTHLGRFGRGKLTDILKLTP